MNYRKTRFLFIFICLCSICIFAGCKNFLNGEDFLTGLDNSISYENAATCEVLVKAAEGTGSTSPNGSVTVKIGFPQNISFEINEKNNYIFAEWRAVKSSDNTVLVTDGVEFENQKARTTKVTITKTLSDIQIIPFCIEQPVVVGEPVPSYTFTGIPQDTSIVVVFNHPMNIEDFYDEENGCFKNIKIQNLNRNLEDPDNNLLEYFEKPYLSEDGDILTIPVDKTKKMIEVNSNENMDIFVSIALSNIKMIIENVEVDFQDDLEWKYRINSQTDNIAPEITSLLIAKTEADLLAGQNLLTDLDFYTYADPAKISGDKVVGQYIHQNHVGKKVYISIKGADNENGSGIREFQVDESIVRDPAGNDYVNPNKETTKHFLLGEKNVNYDENEDKYWFEYEFSSVGDGVARLEITAVDYAGNVSKIKKSYDCIKDTTIGLLSFGNTFGKIYTDIQVIKNGEKGIMELIPVYYLSDSLYASDLSSTPEKYEDGFVFSSEEDGKENFKYPPDIKIIEFRYKNLNDKEWKTSEPKIEKGESDFKYNYTVSGEITDDILMEIEYEDGVGNKRIQKLNKKKVPEILDYSENADNSGWTIYYSATNDFTTMYVCYQYESEEGILGDITAFYNETDTLYGSMLDFIKDGIMFHNFPSSRNSGSLNLNFYEFENFPAGKYHIYLAEMEGNIALLKDWCKDYVIYHNIEKPDPALDASYIPDFTVSVDNAVKSTGLRDVHINLPSGFQQKNGITYYVKYCIENENEYGIEKRYDFSIPSGNRYWFYLVAVNASGNSVCSEKKIIDATEDNKGPEISGGDVDWYFGKKVTFDTPTDDGVGMYENQRGKGELTLFFAKDDSLSNTELEALPEKNKQIVEYDLNATKIEIPIDDINMNCLYVKAKDKNENVAYKLITSYLLSYNNGSGAYNKSFSIPATRDEYGAKYLSLEDFDSENAYQQISIESLENNKWVRKVDDSDGNSYNSIDFYYCSISALTSFIRIGRQDSSSGIPVYWWATYVYPQNLVTPVNCLIKNMVEGTNGITVLVDNPCIVHTLYSINNYGSEYGTWETRGIEIGIDCHNSNFMYDVPLSEIPVDCYYITVAHFADGTVTYTNVKQKKN